MIEQTEVKHRIQKYILSILMHQQFARYRDMRPPKTDTNLYSYHLNQLLKSHLVKKTDEGYTLDTLGLVYIDRVNEETLVVRRQPKTVTMMVVQNSDGGLLLQRRTKQPYIGKWMLPHGKLHNGDSSVVAGVRREAYEKLKVLDIEPRHAGDCYIRVNYGDTPMTVTMAHIFAFEHDDIPIAENLMWVQPHKLHALDLAPAVEEIVARAFFRDPFFFEEYSCEW